MKDMKSILNEYGLHFSEGNRGWLRLNCPWCGDTLGHLGYNSDYGVFHCWRCGRVPLVKTLSMLLGLDIFAAKKLALGLRAGSNEHENSRNCNPAFLEYPSTFGRMDDVQRAYLRSRGIDDIDAESRWGLLGTKGGDLGNRVVLPIRFKGRAVSWSARDVTGRAKVKMLSCPGDKEVMPAKSVLYGYDLARDNTAVVVEGPFDALKFGPGAVAVLGISFTLSQVSLLMGFRNVFILFDSVVEDGVETERDAQRSATRLADMLSASCNVWILNGFNCDPGDMEPGQINAIKKAINKEKEKIHV